MGYEPFDRTHRDDPFPAYRALRDEAPVHRAPVSGAFVVTRYEHAVEVLKSPERFSSDTRVLNRVRRRQMSALQQARLLWKLTAGLRLNPLRMRDARMLILEDPPAHGLMRAIVNRGFTPRRIRSWEKRIEELVHEAMDRVRGRVSFDFIEEVAVPLPVTVISEVLGIPPEDRHLFKHWSDVLIEGGTGSGLEDPAASGVLDVIIELGRYMRPIMRARRADPAEDLISVLVDASAGEAGLTDVEIVLFILLLLVAGNETTTNLLGNAVDALLDHPEQLARVAADPALVPSLVEEALRFDGPILFVRRIAKEGAELAGVPIPRGAQVLPILSSANRDERRFPDPDRLDVDRDTRGHLAFGLGNHFCLGASLARLEASAALRVFVPELLGLERARPERAFVDSFQVRGRRELPLRRRAP